MLQLMEEFFEDIGAEVEVNPDDVETGPKPAKRPRKSKLLRKADKQALLDVLGSLPVTDVVASVITKRNLKRFLKEIYQM